MADKTLDDSLQLTLVLIKNDSVRKALTTAIILIGICNKLLQYLL